MEIPFLHLRFEKRPNPYFYHSTAHDTIKQMHDSLASWKDYYFSLIGIPLNRFYRDSVRWCNYLLKEMDKEYHWVSSSIKTTNFFRYGTFRWELDQYLNFED